MDIFPINHPGGCEDFIFDPVSQKIFLYRKKKIIGWPVTTIIFLKDIIYSLSNENTIYTLCLPYGYFWFEKVKIGKGEIILTYKTDFPRPQETDRGEQKWYFFQTVGIDQLTWERWGGTGRLWGVFHPEFSKINYGIIWIKLPIIHIKKKKKRSWYFVLWDNYFSIRLPPPPHPTPTPPPKKEEERGY